MSLFPTTIILRHERENLKKCSLRGLEQRPDLQFFSYPLRKLPEITGYILLTIDAPPLSNEDRSSGLFLIDGTWRYAAIMQNFVSTQIQLKARSIPEGFITAYPRKQTDCSNPTKGLASVEALFIAYYLLERQADSLLNFYYWKELFLEKNRQKFSLSPATVN